MATGREGQSRRPGPAAPWLALAAAVAVVCLVAPRCAARDELSDLEQVTRGAVARVAPAVVQVIVPELTEAQIEEAKRLDRERRIREMEEAAESPAPPEETPAPESPEEAPSPPPEEAPAPPDESPAAPPEAPAPSGQVAVRTGFLVSAEGHVVTSLLNVGRQDQGLRVKLADGRELPARRLGEDVQRDLVLLKVEGSGFPQVIHAPKSDLLVGQWVVAVGKTLPLAEPTVAKGIVSALGRLAGVAIQTDANISAMNYGGPLIDLRGRVVGMIASVGRGGSTARASQFSDSGIGFVIPLEDILRELPDLKEGQRLEVPFLGIVFNRFRLGKGAEIQTVLAATAAKESGLKEGDIIVEFEGTEIVSSFQLLYQIGSRRVGDKVTFNVLRDGQTLTLSGKLRARPAYLPD